MTSITEIHKAGKPLMAVLYPDTQMRQGSFPNPNPEKKNMPELYETNLLVVWTTTSHQGDIQLRTEYVSPIEKQLIEELPEHYQPGEQLFKSALEIYKMLPEKVVPLLVLSEDREFEQSRYYVNLVFENPQELGYFASLPLEHIIKLKRPTYIPKREKDVDETPSI